MIAGAGVAVTAIELVVPVMEGVNVSVAMMVWGPEVSRVIVTAKEPPGSVSLAGSMALPSLLEKWTVPE